MADNRPPITEEANEIIGKYFPALDHGFVSLVDVMGSDQDIERAARVSYGNGTRKTSETRGLIRFLRNHLHTTPTEMVEFKFHVGMPIFVARQWIRHRTANVNEYSGRYSLMPSLYYTPKLENFAFQSKDNKQGRDALVDRETWEVAVEEWKYLRERTTGHYQWLVGEDVARELSRIDLPLSTYTYWYWKIDLHNLIHFLNLRCDSHAQYEVRAYANIIAGMVKKAAPLSFEAWIDYQFCGERMSRMEMDVLRELIWLKNGCLHGGPSILTEDFLKSKGMTEREIGDFYKKLQPKEVPDFDLDPKTARDWQYYHDLIEKNS